MSQTWQTVLLSLATSLIVSLITFILGLKSGKNQADRATLQSLYKDLYSHFSDLKESLQRNRPKSWESYKKVERGLYSVEYYPPVKELKRSGDILFLKKKIADEALDLEMQVMNYSYDLTKHIPEIHAALISDIPGQFKAVSGCAVRHELFHGLLAVGHLLCPVCLGDLAPHRPESIGKPPGGQLRRLYRYGNRAPGNILVYQPSSPPLW